MSGRCRAQRTAISCVLMGLLLPVAGYSQQPAPEEIDDLAARAMETFQTPGIAIGVVQGGELVYARGHGVREIGRPDPVDPDTLFQIASLTKAFTAAALGILVDEGKLDWDDPVIDYLPEFRMYDPWVTREFTIRDLLTHRSGLGLGAGDLLFWPQAKSTPEDIMRAMRHLQPETSFRTAYAYDNLLYAIAGELVGAPRGGGRPARADVLQRRRRHRGGRSDQLQRFGARQVGGDAPRGRGSPRRDPAAERGDSRRAVEAGDLETGF
jgi:CubicO group peptidase (beta-lactamase class C family)